MRPRFLVLLDALTVQTRKFLQTQWVKHGHRLKNPSPTLFLPALGAFLLVCLLAACLLVYGCQQALQRRSAEKRIEAVRQVEIKRLDDERARAAAEQARIKEEEWQKYARDNSNHAVTYAIVYASRIWIPILCVAALVYALASRAYLFMGLSKILLLLLFLTSLALLVGEAVPFVAEWGFFTEFKGVVEEVAKHLNVPVMPPLWLAVSLVGGVTVEGLSRLGSRSRIIIKPANVTVNIPRSKGDHP